MRRRGECIEPNTPPAPDVLWPDEGARDDSGRWVVLIGEGSDAEQTLDLLRDLWPDVECGTAAQCELAQGER